MPTDKPRVMLTIDENLHKRIDDYRFANRFESRSAAITELIRRGLEAIRAEELESIRKQLDQAITEEHSTGSDLDDDDQAE